MLKENDRRCVCLEAIWYLKSTIQNANRSIIASEGNLPSSTRTAINSTADLRGNSRGGCLSWGFFLEKIEFSPLIHITSFQLGFYTTLGIVKVKREKITIPSLLRFEIQSIVSKISAFRYTKTSISCFKIYKMLKKIPKYESNYQIIKKIRRVINQAKEA